MTGAAGAAPPAGYKPHPVHRFTLLLRRELWEHKGGFFWAPVVTGAIIAVLSLLGTITSSVLFQRAKAAGAIEWDGMEINGAHGIEAAREVFGFAGDVTLLTGVGLTSAVLVFVVFFYALGSLYDERKDRSVLFWKSLPVSDAQTVLSKAMWALLLAPAIAIGVGLAIGFVMWLISAAAMVANGIPGGSAIFTESHPFRVLANVLLALPVYVFWALPTVGWLMFCSAWARSKPFLWAVLVPVLGCTLISWLGSLPGVTIVHDKVWYAIAFRGLLSIVPGSWYLNGNVSPDNASQIDGPEDLALAIDFTSSWQAFATLDLWIGAALGAALIFGAIQLRRRRELTD
ncbi:ABC transporter permease [Luteimonas sp. SJ-92]|uniref:ABC transporter permease n=1 Tax=Luteimonas salinisoli TaxID=2752307 RepID=A0A853JBG4_9GAMM|nr:ABC transporter permease [Luteimonas salinisoli]NZA25950.1 ABC transporter permease [Luteimonas salinisoli]